MSLKTSDLIWFFGVSLVLGGVSVLVPSSTQTAVGSPAPMEVIKNPCQAASTIGPCVSNERLQGSVFKASVGIASGDFPDDANGSAL